MDLWVTHHGCGGSAIRCSNGNTWGSRHVHLKPCFFVVVEENNNLGLKMHPGLEPCPLSSMLWQLGSMVVMVVVTVAVLSVNKH